MPWYNLLFAFFIFLHFKSISKLISDLVASVERIFEDGKFKWSCGCRYHYNVADERLVQHVERGNEDGLFLSSVACCQNLWALIMDAGTGFSAQVYQLSPYFLCKVHVFI